MSENKNHNVEIERKYIIKMPDMSVLALQESYLASRILQIYLRSEKGQTHRIRHRMTDGRVECTETIKIRIDRMSSDEFEQEISEQKFLKLSAEILPGTTPIEKMRHTFVYRNQIFEIDVYPGWHNTAIMETELTCREAIVDMPPFIEILREVTGDRAYSNASMSSVFPPEYSID